MARILTKPPLPVCSKILILIIFLYRGEGRFWHIMSRPARNPQEDALQFANGMDHLTYLTLVHAGVTWDDFWASVRKFRMGEVAGGVACHG
jgi:hypothetical protein